MVFGTAFHLSQTMLQDLDKSRHSAILPLSLNRAIMTTGGVSKAFITFLQEKEYEKTRKKFETEDDIKKIMNSLAIVERLYPDQVLMLCNRSHPKLHYVGSNCEKIFGYSAADFRTLTVQDFFKNIHTEDLPGLQNCFKFMQDAEPYDPISHRFVLHYRFKNRDGHFIHLRDEKMAVETEDGKVVYFSMFKNITQQVKFFHVKLDVYKYHDGNFLKIHTFDPHKSEQTVTPRQNEILALITKGFSTQEIADHLHLSVNTVKNHKQSLFRKTNVKSSVELVSFANRSGLGDS